MTSCQQIEGSVGVLFLIIVSLQVDERTGLLLASRQVYALENLGGMEEEPTSGEITWIFSLPIRPCDVAFESQPIPLSPR